LTSVLRLDCSRLALLGLDLLPSSERVLAAAALRAGLQLLHPCVPLSVCRSPYCPPAPDFASQSRARATTTDCGPAPVSPAASTAVPPAVSVPAPAPSGRRARAPPVPGGGGLSTPPFPGAGPRAPR